MSSAPYPATPHQQEVLRYIAGFQETYGYSPSYAEIGRAIGAMLSSVHERVTALEERGYLRRLQGKQRGIEILHKPELPRGPHGEPMQFVRIGE